MNILHDCIKAFLVGGTICAIGQVLVDYTKLTPARILVSFVVAGVFLSAIGLYEPIIEYAGAGASVPLTGFGHILAQGVKKAISENGLIGILSGGFIASAAGIGASVFFGFLISLIFKPGDKS